MNAIDDVLEPSRLLTLASARAACCLGLEFEELKEVLKSNNSSSEKVEDAFVQRHSLLFIRLHRALDALFCGDLGAQKHWLNSEHHLLGEKPRDLIKTTKGLSSVVSHLESEFSH